VVRVLLLQDDEREEKRKEGGENIMRRGGLGEKINLVSFSSLISVCAEGNEKEGITEV
jgi:hypothetical protein